MNLTAFFEHWRIVENPFKGEEARQDPVFWRLEGIEASVAGEPAAASVASSAGLTVTTHPDFEKIAGGGAAVPGTEFERPATAIVFGEKGSGKTAIRIQLADRLAAYNRGHPDAKCLLVPYDDLNPILDRFCERAPIDRRGKSKHPAAESPLTRFRLVDHIDAMLSLVVPRLVDLALREKRPERAGSKGPVIAGGGGVVIEPGPGDEPRRRLRKLDISARHDLLALQAVYDGPERADIRTRRLRRLLRVSPPLGNVVWTLLAYLGWTGPAALGWWMYRHDLLKPDTGPYTYALLAVTALYLGAVIKRSVYDRLRYISLGHRVRKQVRVLARGDASIGRSLRQLPRPLVDPAVLPMTNAEEPRYAMFDRLFRLLRPLGYISIVMVIDRVDEPSAIGGDPERMKAVIWPMLSNKFLQHPGFGVKMLLPMELRHALFRESSSFFQEARLDKQNLIERLAWTGPMLYDLCNARLQACLKREPDGSVSRPITLLDIFAEDVTRQDLVDSLDQMHQPRDAFKLLYQCLVEHCSSVSHDSVQFRIPRHVLENIRKQQTERVKQLYRGVRPA